MKNMHRTDTLPETFIKWLSGQNIESIEHILRNKINRKIEKLGLDMNNPAELETQILQNDEKYYALQDSGNANECMPFFCKARLLSAAKFMHQGEFDDAIYEYFHSFNTDNPEEIIEDLKGA